MPIILIKLLKVRLLETSRRWAFLTTSTKCFPTIKNKISMKQLTFNK